MKEEKRVLVIGLNPASVVDYSHWPGLNAEKLRATLDKEQSNLNADGYRAELCLFDLGETAETVVEQALVQKSFDYVVIGAGVRIPPENFLLFEKMVNVVHQHAPTAKICFNTNPSDTKAAVLRWI